MRTPKSSLALFLSASEQVGWATEAAAFGAEGLALSERSYAAGAVDTSALLDSERTAASAEDGLAAARLARLQACVDLVKALGGEPVADPALSASRPAPDRLDPALEFHD